MTFIATTLTSLLSILVALVGPKLADEKQRNTIRTVALLIGIIAASASLLKTFAIIPTGTIGVLEVFGKVSQQSLSPGVHWVNPFGRVVKFSTRMRDIRETVTATSSEGVSVTLAVNLQYKLDPKVAADIYETIGTEETEIVTSRFRSIVRQITSNYSARAVYTESRDEVTAQLREQLRASLTPLGFVVEEALLTDVVLPDTLQAAIAEKLQAQQESQRMQFILEKERQEAERKRIEAEGIADFQQIVAEGITPKFLEWKRIEATDKLSNSENAKIIFMGDSTREAQFPVTLKP